MCLRYERQREILQNKTNKLIGITKPSIEIFLTREGQDTETHKKILEAVGEFITSTDVLPPVQPLQQIPDPDANRILQ